MNKLAALVFLLIGLMLLVYMVVYESEPGALSLLVVIIGSIWCWRARVFRRLD